MALLEVVGLTKRFAGRGRGPDAPPAVDDVSFTLEAGRTLAIVGESGAGKSTVGRIVTRLATADAGVVRFDGEDLLALRGRALHERRRDLQMVFQDPYGSLDPRMTIGAAVAEPLKVYKVGLRAEREERAIHALERVGLSGAVAARKPHELSGGQLQRVSIARALMLGPKLIVCDEAVAALDVSVRAKVLNLLLDLQEQEGFSYLFITHDLGLLEGFADDVMVMRAGRVEELGPAEQVLHDPRGTYTRALLADVPTMAEAMAPAGGSAV